MNNRTFVKHMTASWKRNKFASKCMLNYVTVQDSSQDQLANNRRWRARAQGRNIGEAVYAIPVRMNYFEGIN